MPNQTQLFHIEECSDLGLYAQTPDFFVGC
ncbi:hypothetical protein CFBP6109_01043 [Pseudomonas syringae pv. cerasicola]|uniref:Uncharacterized protein n=1 Tax=Pseudomonas coronafaciens pv. garcae TaxID=251653 RepID=A0AB37QLE5_9PSED|nr:hypothetical protein ALP74_200130 [Pseudomonas coronafaciens pv. garcae]SOS15172.1 hypothetical protein CFBP6109_01043 [Pseudomonas syringae pv. cerasicola]SPF16661.1 hypothetical protein PSCFBP6110_04193 [Pseudomonas syringae pv. cerasicola]